MVSLTVPAAVSFIGSRQAFLPARAPMATPARQMRVLAAKGTKNNIAKVGQLWYSQLRRQLVGVLSLSCSSLFVEDFVGCEQARMPALTATLLGQRVDC